MEQPSVEVVRAQAATRILNERIEVRARELAPDAGSQSPLQVRCECGRAGCAAIIEVMRGEYEAARLDGRFFLVAPGHGVDAIEAPLARSPRYELVKTFGAAATQATALASRRPS